MKLNYLITCEHVARDGVGKMSINNIFDVVGGDKLPIVPPRFCIVFSINIEKKDIPDNKINFLVELISPSKKPVFEIQGNGDIKEEGNAVTDLDLSGKFQLHEKGTHTIRISANGKRLAENKLMVVLGKVEDYK